MQRSSCHLESVYLHQLRQRFFVDLNFNGFNGLTFMFVRRHGNIAIFYRDSDLLETIHVNNCCCISIYTNICDDFGAINHNVILS